MSGKVRTYKLYACECGYRDVRSGKCRSHPFPCRAMGPTMQPVTAVDLRDVEPLLEALREIGDAAKAEAADALEWATWAHELAQKTLEPFRLYRG